MKNYIGKIHVKWCQNCNVPLIGKRCGVCGEESFSVKLTPPGDARIGFKYDIEFINSIIKKEYGSEPLSGKKVILINKIPSEEESYEIIEDGVVKYLIYYNNGWKVKLKPYGALDIGKTKKFVKVENKVLDLLKNKKISILRPGILEIGEFERGDDVIILDEDNKVVGVGLSQVSSEEAKEMEKGKVVKVRGILKDEKRGEREYRDLEEAFKVMVEANKEVVEKYERNAIGFIRNTAKKINKKIIVPYSGGKDSLTTLILCLKALENFEVIFIDTGLEFPETLKNVEEVKNKFNLDIKVLKPKLSFWELVEKYGIPGRDYRWCSEELKLKPLKEYVKEEVLSFLGLRKYESYSRAKKKLIEKNTYIEKQINAYPIFHWSSLHVWLFLLKEKAPYNKLYEKGFDRIGCYLCPAMGLGEIERVKKFYPELWERFEKVLKKFFSEEEIRRGTWRVRKKA
ncbi:phosphoadenosine phosphosulfate reductase [Methanocaldococcus infernus ME]|uniref:Phosphoadenosine phosphosulfate reductase n=1 Tax=Methanocaldococcus infernus (strain DSM 11812 / JCM 15783 / ME) TaxID=573063 RepID=D5VRA3_METIM|nr:phosphoadenosine phosphosulfate reductase family protein [Methanocaldococcus infernus]ADG13106.1 phosphoadenosine phosphosulfate reductase [Methanocaldococcus infernus ME]